MKGVVLAGGTGSRLAPTTHVVNKHVLPVYDRPMIYYPVEMLLRSGIDEVLVVSTPEATGRYIRLLEEEFDAEFTYRVQKEPKGIAHALALAEEFVEDSVAVVLGDNIVLEDFSASFEAFERSGEDARVFLKRVSEPARYGVAELEDGSIRGLVEKPTDGTSKHAVIGLYLYTDAVFDVIPEIERSDRGEYEITDVNERFLERDELGHEVVEAEWFDVGTPDGLLAASNFVAGDDDG